MAKLTRQTLSSSFSVGQVLYVFSTQEKTIIPVQVVIKDKQIIEKLGSSGPEEQTTYRVVLPNDKTKLHILSEIPGEIYTSLQEVQNFLERKMKEQITKLVFQTKEKSRACFGKAAEKTFGLVEEHKQEQQLPDEMDEFLASATTEDHHEEQQSSNIRTVGSDVPEEQYVILEDGQRIKARSITLINNEHVG